MTYQNALKYLDSLINYEKKRFIKYNDTNFNLNKLIKISQRLKLNNKNIKIFHIAGSNGKGSITTMIYTLLINNGYRAGLFISPHIINIRERIQANGKFISKKDFAKCIAKIKALIKKFKYNLTFFEIITFAAMFFFKKINCEYICLETGLGGRLDSTNIFNTNVSIISSVTLEHTDKLGNTIEQIAFEKAGIIKKNTPVIVGNIDQSALKIIEKIADEKNSKLYKFGIDINATNIHLEINKTFFKYHPNNTDIEIPLCGINNPQNASIALFALKLLKINIKPIFSNINLPARFSIINKDPLVILDGSHNSEASKILSQTIKIIFNEKKVCFILGFLKDKNFKCFIDNILSQSLSIDVVKINHFYDNSYNVYEYVKKIFINSNYFKNNIELIKYIKQNKDKIFIITGSFYLCSAILKNKSLFEKNNLKK